MVIFEIPFLEQSIPFKMDDALKWKDGIKGFQKTILKEFEYAISNNE